MAQGTAGAPAWVASVMRLVTAGLENIRMYVGDVIGYGDITLYHVDTLATFFVRLRLHKHRLSLNKSPPASNCSVTSSFQTASDRMTSHPCACRCPRTLNNSEFSLVALSTTARSSRTWSATSARSWSSSKRALSLMLLEIWGKGPRPPSRSR